MQADHTARPQKLGGCTWAFVWTSPMEQCLSRLQAVGYEVIDVLTIPPHAFPSSMDKAERSSLRSFVARQGISLETLNIPSTDVNLASVNKDMRQFTVRQIRAAVELANDLGIPMVTTVPGRRLNFSAPPDTMTMDWITEALEEILPHAAKMGVIILFETHPQSCIPTIKRLTEYLDKLNASDIGLALDVSNISYVGEDPAVSIRNASRWLRQVHLSDTPLGAWRHDIIGMGDLNFTEIFSAVTESGFQGTSIVEISCDDPDQGYAMSRRALEAIGWRA